MEPIAEVKGDCEVNSRHPVETHGFVETFSSIFCDASPLTIVFVASAAFIAAFTVICGIVKCV